MYKHNFHHPQNKKNKTFINTVFLIIIFNLFLFLFSHFIFKYEFRIKNKNKKNKTFLSLKKHFLYDKVCLQISLESSFLIHYVTNNKYIHVYYLTNHMNYLKSHVNETRHG